MMVNRKRLPVYGLIALLVLATAMPVGGMLALDHEVETTPVALHAFWLMILPAGIVVMLVKRKKWIPRRLLFVLATVYYLFNLVFITLLYPMVYRLNPVSKSLKAIPGESQLLVAYQDFNPAFLFNMPEPGSRVTVYQKPDSLKLFLNSYRGTRNVYILTREDRLPSIDTSFYIIVSRHHDLFENPTTIALKKK